MVRLIGRFWRRETYTRDQSGDAATPSTADSEDTNHKFDGGCDEGNNVCDEHPLGNSLVDVQGLLHTIRHHIFNARILQAPDLHRVEPELGLWFGTEGRLEVVVLDISVAIAPEADGVEILEVGCFLGFFEGLGQLLVRRADAVLL